ncbi:hypothetical protein [Bifidobacterium callitrichidarum]|uniref:Uncharacterized protein n=1 Tax=Bifidobacterium callitrichidarum TaxID=2052941 RepID=A0A2U2NC94_9BIFI|nr:hypothetical protein [Bifidobacterium callitrichidarum]PWG66771.1 hypothetical protein DF196_02390 [Bifidobacterium callitrichidarum]
MGVRRIVPIILEGTTDADVLVDAFNKLLHSSAELKEICEAGDITLYRMYSNGRQGVSGKSPIAMVHQAVMDNISQHHSYAPKDILAILQVMDLDGCMIPDENVVKGERLVYMEDRIITPKVTALRNRNREKTSVIRELASTPEDITVRFGGRSIPYRPFYMSRNLEHVFWDDDSVLTAVEKSRRANRKWHEYHRNPSQLLVDLSQPDILHGYTDYTTSWQWPWIDCNSLHRGSNVAFLKDVVSTLAAQ